MPLQAKENLKADPPRRFSSRKVKNEMSDVLIRGNETPVEDAILQCDPAKYIHKWHQRQVNRIRRFRIPALNLPLDCQKKKLLMSVSDEIFDRGAFFELSLIHI